jgi:murein DD-endopeptidase MepM/ murein hydrolase activator NlpD
LGHSAAAVETVSEGNVQTLGLLASVGANPGANLGLGGGDNTIVGASALLPDSGPVGTLADIIDFPASGQVSTYLVRSGDSLSEIADMFDVSVNTVAWANGLDPKKTLQPGQTLVILPVSGVRHTVVKGETLAQIAKKYKGEVEEIIVYNGLESEALRAGQLVIIPNGEVPTASGSVGGRAPVVREGGTTSGYYRRPVNGGVKTQGLHGYNGVDIASAAGTEILAAAAGKVVVSRSGGWNGGYGNYLVIEHANGTQTLYAHLLNNLVSAGQSVKQGQVVGTMGSTGRSTGNHLHFEVRGAKNPF